MHAEEKMRVAHQEDIQRREEMAMSLLAKMNEMVQEDQGATLRIEELERQRGMLSNAMQRLNQSIKYIKVRSLITFVVSRESKKPVKLNIYATGDSQISTSRIGANSK